MIGMVRHPPRHQKHQQTEQGKARQHGQGGLQQQPVEQVGGREADQGWQSDFRLAAEFRGGQLPSRRGSLPGQQGFGARKHLISAGLPQPLFIGFARRSLLCGL